MSPQLWTAVDRFITDHLVPSDSALDHALQASTAGGLPGIQVAPNQGKMLHVLAKLCHAKKILELGTLGAYSTIWLARALPADGKLITLEANATHAKVAQANIDRAGLSKLIELREGKALDTLPKIANEKIGPFDVIFIDADKPNIPAYYEWAIKLSHAGTLIIVDNVVRDGQVADAKSKDPNVTGVRKLYEILAADNRVTSTALQTVGSKGYDGFIMAVVN